MCVNTSRARPTGVVPSSRSVPLVRRFASGPVVTVSAVLVTARKSAIGITSCMKSGAPEFLGASAPIVRKIPIIPKGKNSAK